MDEHHCESIENPEVLQHRLIDMAIALKKLQDAEKDNTAFRLRTEGGLRFIQWVGLSGAVAVAALMANHII